MSWIGFPIIFVTLSGSQWPKLWAAASF